MFPSSRKDAIAIGSKVYRTNEPCKNGHISNRYTQSGGCVACVVATAQRNRDQKELKYRGFERVFFLVHRDDLEAVEAVAKLLRDTRLAALSAPTISGPLPDVSGKGIHTTGQRLPTVPDSRPDWFLP